VRVWNLGYSLQTEENVKRALYRRDTLDNLRSNSWDRPCKVDTSFASNSISCMALLDELREGGQKNPGIFSTQAELLSSMTPPSSNIIC
jgi:hypothetical protein